MRTKGAKMKSKKSFAGLNDLIKLLSWRDRVAVIRSATLIESLTLKQLYSGAIHIFCNLQKPNFTDVELSSPFTWFTKPLNKKIF